MLIDATYRENGKKCRVTIAKEPVSLFTPACMALGKDGPYTTAINEQLIDNHLLHNSSSINSLILILSAEFKPFSRQDYWNIL